MISCRRPSNRSSRLAFPLGPSNLYSFSTAIHGIRRRSAASASRAWVSSFSFTRSFWREASHPFGDTIFAGFIWFFFFSASLVFISNVLCSYLFSALVKLTKQRGDSSARCRADGNESNVGDACGTHVDSLFTSFFFSRMAGFPLLNTRPDDRAIPPRIFDTPAPIARLFLAVWRPIAFRARVRNAAVATAPLFREREDVSKQQARTLRAVVQDR